MNLRNTAFLCSLTAASLGLVVSGCTAAPEDPESSSSNVGSGDAMAQYRSAIESIERSDCGQRRNLDSLVAEHDRLNLAGNAQAFIDAIAPIATDLISDVIPKQRSVLRSLASLSSAAGNHVFDYPQTRSYQSQFDDPWLGITQWYGVVWHYPADYTAVLNAGGKLREEQSAASATCTSFLGSFSRLGTKEGELAANGKTNPTSDLRRLESDLATDRTRYTYARDGLRLVQGGGSVDAATFFSLMCGREPQCEATHLDLDGGLGNHLGYIVNALRAAGPAAYIEELESAIASTTRLIATIRSARANVEETFGTMSRSWQSFEQAFSLGGEVHRCAYYLALEPTARRLKDEVERVDPGFYGLNPGYIKPAAVLKGAARCK